MTTTLEKKDIPVAANRGDRHLLHLAIVGASGAVGQEFLKVLADRNFPIGKLTLLSSARSAGKQMEFAGQQYTLKELDKNSFKGVDLALFSAGGSVSKKFAPIAVEAGAVVVDNSSAFRMTDGVPLIVPEVNPDAVGDIAVGSKPGVIANPNCSTILMITAVTPLHRVAKVRRMVVSTYQAASGAGAAAMAELEQQSKEALAGEPITKEIFPFQYAFNCFSHNSPMEANGYNQEEMKMVNETHKIWGDQNIQIAATCVRVPVMRAHGESINLEFESAIDEQQARNILGKAPGVSVTDDRENNNFPTPLDASGKDDIYIGRIRQDISRPEGNGLEIFICGDQIRKGAALNAVQIAELIVKKMDNN